MNLKKIANNTAWIIGCRLVQALFALAISMLTARYLGPSGFGLISYAASVAAFAAPVMQLGIHHIIIRELVRAPEQEGSILGTALGLNFASGCLCVLGVVSFAAIANAGEPDTILVCALYSLMLVFQSTEVFQYWFQARLKSKYVSLAVLAAYILVSGYKIFLLASGKPVSWFAVSNAIDYGLISAILFFLYRRQGGPPLRFSKATAAALLSAGRYYIVPSLMVMVFAQTDRVMLKFMMGDAAVGCYSAAVTVTGLTGFLFTAIISSFQPVIYDSHRRDHAAFESAVSTLYGIVCYLSLAQSVLMSLTAPVLIRILYGSGYEPAVSALRIVVWYTAFSCFGSVRNIWILAENKQRFLWILNLCGALGNVLMNWFLIPLWGINGAALASLLTQIFTNVVASCFLPPLRQSNRLLAAGLHPRLFRHLARQLRGG